MIFHLGELNWIGLLFIFSFIEHVLHFFVLQRNTIVSSSLDSTIRVWSTANEKCLHIIRAHEGPVSAISLHATGDYVLSASVDEVSFFRLALKTVAKF